MTDHLHWDAEGLWLQLRPLLPTVSVEVVAQCGSTNTELLERARRQAGRREQDRLRGGALLPVTGPVPFDEGEIHGSPYGRRAEDTQPCLLVAEAQTQGRGRQGREWKASAGTSLTFSLSMPLAPTDWSGLSLAVGVALAEALAPVMGQGRRLGLKWPNDLWLREPAGGGRKLGGILIETTAIGRQRMVVVGVGLNVLPPADDAMAGFSSGHACLQEAWPDASAPAALHRVALPLAGALQAFEREGFAAFAERFAALDLLDGRPVRLLGDGLAPGVPAEGMADGVDLDGALRLRDAAGAVHRITSGDVSVRLDGAGGAEG